MSFPQAIGDGFMALCALAALCAILFGAHSCYTAPRQGDPEMIACTQAGGNWVISEKTEGSSPDYECQMN